MIKKVIFVLIGVLILSCIGLSVTMAANGDLKEKKFDVNDEKTLSVSGISDININTVSENVNIILTAENSVTVEYHGTYSCLVCRVTQKMKADISGNTILIKSDNPAFAIMMYDNVKMDVYIPETYTHSLTLSSVSGNINLTQPMQLEHLNASSTSGNINLSGTRFSDGTFSTVSGDLIGDGLSGDFHMTTTSGNMNLTNFSGNIKASSVSGDMNIQESGNPFSVNIHTVSGNIVLDINNDVKYVLSTSTVSGDIKNDIPDNETSGSSTVSFNSVSGDLTIR